MAQQVKDLALSVLWHGFDSLARELPRAVGAAKKKAILYLTQQCAYS